MAFEDNLTNGFFKGTSEKTFIDKILAKEDVEAIRKLIKKSNLTREELLEILYLISGTEAKLVNYSDWDRYVVMKYFVWIREFIQNAELLYDYFDYIESKRINPKGSDGKRKDLSADVIKKENRIKISEKTDLTLESVRSVMEHNAKFLIDMYLNIVRTSMSIGGTGFLEILKNKYEIHYPNMPGVTDANSAKSSGFLGLKR
jgi:hypothetical protein